MLHYSHQRNTSILPPLLTAILTCFKDGVFPQRKKKYQTGMRFLGIAPVWHWMKHAPRRADAKGPTVQASRSVRGATFPNSRCWQCPVPCCSTQPQGRLPQHRFSLALLCLTLSAQACRVKGDAWGTASSSTSTREGRLISALRLRLHARARRKRMASSPRCLRKHLAKTRCRRTVLPAQYFISSGVGRQWQSDGSPCGWEWDLLALAAAARKGSFSPPLRAQHPILPWPLLP